DDLVEQSTFAPRDSQAYDVHYVQADLIPPGALSANPWSSIKKELRDQVDGIMLLKACFTAEDLELFPKLKVSVLMGVGCHRLDRRALGERGVTVCNVPKYGTCEIAYHAIALALSLRRGVLLH
ncbi:uncharacterized protein A1O9_07538, partial [Exophiala aquamarina CBS 119918]